MMLVFENQLIYGKNCYKEYYKYICFKRPISIIINIILFICFFISILSIVFPELHLLEVSNARDIIVIDVILLCAELYIYIKTMNNVYNEQLEKSKRKLLEVKISVTKENINISTNVGKSIDIEFIDIEKAIETKNYYFLISRAKTWIAFKKDSFTKGTVKEFEEFLKQKKLIK